MLICVCKVLFLILKLQSQCSVIITTFFLHSDRVHSAEVDGTVYFANKSVVVCCDFDESTDMPTFGEITDIVVTPSRKVLFVMQTLVTDYFEQHYLHTVYIAFTENVTYTDHQNY